MENTPQKEDAPTLPEAERKEREDQTAKKLSKNPDEAVEKSIAKSSKDEEKSTPG